MSRHSLTGRKKQVAGALFEHWVEGQHKIALAKGLLVHVEHSEPHCKVINGRLIYTACGVADYFGTLAGGKSLAVEAKSIDSTSFPYRLIKPKQIKHLDAVANAGGVAVLLVNFAGVKCAMEWRQVPWKVKRSAKSIDLEDVQRYEVPSTTSACYLDYLVK